MFRISPPISVGRFSGIVRGTRVFKTICDTKARGTGGENHISHTAVARIRFVPASPPAPFEFLFFETSVSHDGSAQDPHADPGTVRKLPTIRSLPVFA